MSPEEVCQLLDSQNRFSIGASVDVLAMLYVSYGLRPFCRMPGWVLYDRKEVETARDKPSITDDADRVKLESYAAKRAKFVEKNKETAGA